MGTNANVAMMLPPDANDQRRFGGMTQNMGGTVGTSSSSDRGGLGGMIRRMQQAASGQYNYNNVGLPNVDDPDDAYAEITRQEYLDYVNNYRGFEEQLIQQAQNDTSLIDQARDDVQIAQGLALGISNRTNERYGAALTPAQRQQQDLRLQRANTLGGVQSVNDARIAQREANTALLSDLINIGQGVNRASQQQLGSAAADATARQNAYTAARAQSRASTYSALGSLGAAAIFAFAF